MVTHDKNRHEHMDKYEGKVVPQVQVLQVKKFNFEEW